MHGGAKTYLFMYLKLCLFSVYSVVDGAIMYHSIVARHVGSGRDRSNPTRWWNERDTRFTNSINWNCSHPGFTNDVVIWNTVICLHGLVTDPTP